MRELGLILIALLFVGCTNTPSTTSPTLQTKEIEPPVSYIFSLVTKHEKGSTIDVNVFVSKDTTQSQVQELLEYFRDVKYKDYTSVTILVYNNGTSAETPPSKFNPDDPYFLGQLNKYSRTNSGPLKDGQIILN